MEISDGIFLLDGFTLLKTINYIDPGSASAVIAIIIGGIVGAGMTLKMYWFKIKQKITKN